VNLKPSKPLEPARVVCQIEAWEVSDHRIEVRAAALDMLTPDNSMGWGEVFLDEFYNMINLKWNVKLILPNVVDTEDMPMNAVRVQLYHDFGISEITSRRVTTSDPNKISDGAKDNPALLPTIDDDEIIRRLDSFNDALQQGLPPIEAINVSLQRSTKRGPVTYSDDEKLKALREWRFKKGHDQSLEEFLENRFGTENGILKVAPSTFHGWRGKFKNKG
jgi:hypothetical protein